MSSLQPVPFAYLIYDIQVASLRGFCYQYVLARSCLDAWSPETHWKVGNLAIWPKQSRCCLREAGRFLDKDSLNQVCSTQYLHQDLVCLVQKLFLDSSFLQTVLLFYSSSFHQKYMGFQTTAPVWPACEHAKMRPKETWDEHKYSNSKTAHHPSSAKQTKGTCHMICKKPSFAYMSRHFQSQGLKNEAWSKAQSNDHLNSNTTTRRQLLLSFLE